MIGNPGAWRSLGDALRRLAERLTPPQPRAVPIPVRVDDPRRRIG